jgi:hypothetical protein
VTAEGEALRAQADELTNAYYYRHWDCLNRSEVEEFRQLLEALKQESEKLAAD